MGSPFLPSPPPAPDSTAASRAPQRAPPLPASAATFRGARPAGPSAAVTRWGVSAAVTAAWPAARASRASGAARAPHPRPAARLEEAKCDSEAVLEARQGGGGGYDAKPL